ncbi:MAG: hypothetical protein Q9160_007442 [Pyrenula sp. 1 TL-2023]
MAKESKHTMAQPPDFQSTSLDAIPQIVERVRSGFFSKKTRSVDFRLAQLRKLYWGLVDHEDEIIEACRRDLGKPIYEAQLTEVKWVQNDIIYVCSKLKEWLKDEVPADMGFINSLVNPKIRKDPLGCCLVIGYILEHGWSSTITDVVPRAFNFPIQLSVGPLIGAIAGGNTAILKPSENSPSTAAVLQKVIVKVLDPSCFAVIQGGVPETQALLAEKWDKIFFTGSANVGKIVAKAAASNLTPITLELGGRNPAIVTRNADVRLTARRLLWGKLLNAGQVCISQNYILADKSVVSSLITELGTAYREFFPNGAKASPDYGRIVNEQAYGRIKKMLDSTSGKIVLGGTMDAEQKFIEPTVIVVDSPADSLITDESFGPLIPILPVTDLTEAIHIANSVHATPLGLYPFGTKAETDRILTECRSGGASVNDAFFHGSIPTLSFGGVGDSGSGSYRGKSSFDTFVHRRSVTVTPKWIEKFLSVRYPPYQGKYDQYARTSVLAPNFDREGRVKRNWLKVILTLGTGGWLRGAMRAVLVAAFAMAVKLVMEGRS